MTRLMPRPTTPDVVAPAAASAPVPPARRRRLGPTDLWVSPVTIGGNAFGLTADAEAVFAVLDAYRDWDGNVIDTAGSSAEGRSQSMIGDWMRSRGNRDHLVLATKVDGHGTGREGSGAVIAAIDASLRRLGTDYLDVVYVQASDESVPFEETLVVLDEQVRAGRVRYAGLAEHSGNRVIEARVIAAQLGLTPMSAVQARYNLLHRTDYEGTLAGVVAQQRLGVVPRFALDGGFLAGRYRSKSDLGDDSRTADAREHLKRGGQRVLTALGRVAAEHETSLAAVAIAWLLTKPNVVAPVASASRPDHVAAMMAAGSVQLTRQQVAALDAVSA